VRFECLLHLPVYRVDSHGGIFYDNFARPGQLLWCSIHFEGMITLAGKPGSPVARHDPLVRSGASKQKKDNKEDYLQ
jgi:hypothetical protein